MGAERELTGAPGFATIYPFQRQAGRRCTPPSMSRARPKTNAPYWIGKYVDNSRYLVVDGRAAMSASRLRPACSAWPRG